MHSPTISTTDIQNKPTVTYTEFVCNGILSLTTFHVTLAQFVNLLLFLQMKL